MEFAQLWGSTKQQLSHGAAYYDVDSAAGVAVSDVVAALDATCQLPPTYATLRTDEDVAENLRGALADCRRFLKERQLTPANAAAAAAAAEKPVPTADRAASAPTPVSERKAKGALAPLDEAEFAAVPKYMRGRLRVAEVNGVVARVDAALHSKYAVVKQPLRKLLPADRERALRYREQEVDGTRGRRFCVDADLKGQVSAKEWRAIVPILRHCRRVMEVRGGGLVRYVVA